MLLLSAQRKVSIYVTQEGSLLPIHIQATVLLLHLHNLLGSSLHIPDQLSTKI